MGWNFADSRYAATDDYYLVFGFAFLHNAASLEQIDRESQISKDKLCAFVNISNRLKHEFIKLGESPNEYHADNRSDHSGTRITVIHRESTL